MDEYATYDTQQIYKQTMTQELELQIENNFILKADSYKTSHPLQYPKGTTIGISYLESRGGAYDYTLMFAAQALVKKNLVDVRITVEMVEQADAFCLLHFGRNVFYKEGWMYIATELNGILPLLIKAAPEGSVIPTGNVLLTIENTDPNCWFLFNFVETMLMRIWYPITIATNSMYAKKIIHQYMVKTGCDLANLPLKLVDFGLRGVSSEETGAIGGMAHLLSFSATDNIAGIIAANTYYGTKEFYDNGNGMKGFTMAGFSIPASEHSTVTSWGRECEMDAFLNMLKIYPTGPIAFVIDSFNAFVFAEAVGQEPIRSKILERDGVVIFRPDSGNPVEVNSKLIDILWNNFGGGYTDKWYKLLDKHVRIIQGDGIDLQMIDAILHMAETKKFAADNWSFGSGGGLLQKFDRDTLKFAIKCSYLMVNGEERDVQKDPITSKGKKSKKGKLKLHYAGGKFTTISSSDTTPQMFSSYIDYLQPIFENGKLLVNEDFETVKSRAAKFFETLPEVTSESLRPKITDEVYKALQQFFSADKLKEILEGK